MTKQSECALPELRHGGSRCQCLGEGGPDLKLLSVAAQQVKAGEAARRTREST